jgi:hypothetical protein
VDTAQGAFAQTAGALDRFAEELAAAQRQMAGVRAEAERTFQSLQSARADRAGLREPLPWVGRCRPGRAGRL